MGNIAVLYPLLVVPLSLIASAIFFLRKSHPHEIYWIWLLFSFFFVLFYFLELVAENNHVILADVFGPSLREVFRTTHDFLTNISGEVKLVVSVVGLVTLPQLLTYLLCGLSGSASTPRFVSYATKVAVWMLVKFLAVLAGILLGESGLEVTGWFAAASVMAMAFWILLIYHLISRVLETIAGTQLPFVWSIHQFFIRFGVPSSPTNVLNQPRFEHADYKVPDGAERP
jgi:hypothetical protein